MKTQKRYSSFPWTGGYEIINSADGEAICEMAYAHDAGMDQERGKNDSLLMSKAPEMFMLILELVQLDKTGQNAKLFSLLATKGNRLVEELFWEKEKGRKWSGKILDYDRAGGEK